jgi:hypothetical protein
MSGSAPGVRKIVSGGQTGVDRAALDVALELGLPHGGWCPRGRKSEDGIIPPQYDLQETPSDDYAERTERNVVDSDGTLVLCFGEPTGGTALTLRLARRHGKPSCVAPLEDASRRAALEKVSRWLRAQPIAVLNVAGPRESQAPGAGAAARALLRQLWLEEIAPPEAPRPLG